ncbi:MAG: hypothetical protein OEU36_09045, partial [Gammaproteobacteria bacterium]|nr:hypothetical protein [Gammaproteobacteria bacterium]
AQQRFIKMVAQGEFSESSLAVIERILMEDYSAPEVTDLRTYSDQSVAINHRIWKRLLANHEAIPDVAYLELEKIVSKLLEKDLVNPGSLAGSVMFDPELRRCILTELDGARVCWETKKLAERLLMDSAPGGQCKDSNRGGTVFFWGISNALRKVPLYLTTSDTAGDVLQGIDDKGHRFEWPFNSHSVLQGLRAKRLIPSLFTSFLTLSFARGVTCLGGYYQAEYLPAIQDGVVRALRRFYNYRHAADCVTKVHTRAYLGGMQAVMRRIDREHLVPAGPLEIIASGGLTTEELRLIRSLTVRDAHIASLFETITELGLASIAPNDWKRQLAEVCNGILRDQIVIK